MNSNRREYIAVFVSIIVAAGIVWLVAKFLSE